LNNFTPVITIPDDARENGDGRPTRSRQSGLRPLISDSAGGNSEGQSGRAEQLRRARIASEFYESAVEQSKYDEQGKHQGARQDCPLKPSQL